MLDNTINVRTISILNQYESSAIATKGIMSTHIFDSMQVPQIKEMEEGKKIVLRDETYENQIF